MLLGETVKVKLAAQDRVLARQLVDCIALPLQSVKGGFGRTTPRAFKGGVVTLQARIVEGGHS